MGDQLLGRQAALDQPRRRHGSSPWAEGPRRLDHPLLALAAGVFRPAGDDDLVLRRDHVEPLRAVFADRSHRLAATGTSSVRGLDDDLDPRTDLVRQLLEYKRFKDASYGLADAERIRDLRFEGGLDGPPETGPDAGKLLQDVGVGDLLLAFERMMRETLAEVDHQVFREELPMHEVEERIAAQLAAALPDVTVGLVHGRMPPAAREKAMARFKAGEIGLLVATTVIEVGVDVPNASLMVIENAERMGLAQLHQLRGRVGRGPEASSCLLLWHAPLSPLAKERLAVLRATNDGFEVARRDLELRGPGELLGTRQTGLMQLKVADLMRDADLLPRVQKAADVMLSAHADNMAALKRRWIGASARYGKV